MNRANVINVVDLKGIVNLTIGVISFILIKGFYEEYHTTVFDLRLFYYRES